MFARLAAGLVLPVLVCAAMTAVPARVPAAEASVTVFAAASLKNALDDVDAAFTRNSGIAVVASYAASSTLARQIEAGAPAGVFISADLDWMDYAEQKKLIAPNTRVNLLGNELVLIAPKDSPIREIAIARGVDLAARAGAGRIATGDVRAVPAGRYARAALENLGMWGAVASRLAPAESVRAALALVGRGEAALGIVYATDARIEPNVKIVGTFSPDSHAPIVYPIAATAGATPQALAYAAFLRTAAAKAIFERYGFSFLPPPTS
jgi:molybdate transport system substrate-binding protein